MGTTNGIFCKLGQCRPISSNQSLYHEGVRCTNVVEPCLLLQLMDENAGFKFSTMFLQQLYFDVDCVSYFMFII